MIDTKEGKPYTLQLYSKNIIELNLNIKWNMKKWQHNIVVRNSKLKSVKKIQRKTKRMYRAWEVIFMRVLVNQALFSFRLITDR